MPYFTRTVKALLRKRNSLGCLSLPKDKYWTMHLIQLSQNDFLIARYPGVKVVERPALGRFGHPQHDSCRNRAAPQHPGQRHGARQAERFAR